VNIISSDYIAGKMAEARQRELHAEAEKSRLVEMANKEIKPVSIIRLPKFIRFGQN
jgi:hypothetical protein